MLNNILLVNLYWILLIPVFGGVTLLLPRLTRYAFFFASAGSLALIVFAIKSFTLASISQSYAIGLPQLGVQLRLDALSSFFLLILGCGTLGMQLFSVGYFKSLSSLAIISLFSLLQLFIASMLIIFLADDVFTFLFAWEVMALSSYGLVMHDAKESATRQAGFIYLLMAHFAVLCLIAAFLVLGQGQLSFSKIHTQAISPLLASCVFLLALLGFGAKAGLLPLHTWLPEAHPAAPSPISALMSGVMLKTAAYGLLRIIFDLLPLQLSWWGILLIVVGILTALYGVIYAAVQSDMKRLLAYSSIENMGIIFMGIGLALLFFTFKKNTMAIIAFAATLYHCLNHAFFKNLLFLGTGNVLHATGERNLGKLGGLIHRMPWVSALLLVGVFAAAGVPPFNGFISEWLILQAYLFFPNLPTAYLAMLIPVMAAAFMLAVALAGYVMVKFYGIIFLGRPRENTLHEAADARVSERAGLLWFAAGCLVLGVFPTLVLAWINSVTTEILHAPLVDSATQHWWLIAPVSYARASYSPILYFFAIVFTVALTAFLIRMFYHGQLRRVDAWDCGYRWQTPRMQDTAEGFGQPVRRIFAPLFQIKLKIPKPDDTIPLYVSEVQDRFWAWCYYPMMRMVYYISDWVGRIRCGKISIYLLYSFVTLIVLILLI